VPKLQIIFKEILSHVDTSVYYYNVYLSILLQCVSQFTTTMCISDYSSNILAPLKVCVLSSCLAGPPLRPTPTETTKSSAFWN